MQQIREKHNPPPLTGIELTLSECIPFYEMAKDVLVLSGCSQIILSYGQKIIVADIIKMMEDEGYRYDGQTVTKPIHRQ